MANNNNRSLSCVKSTSFDCSGFKSSREHICDALLNSMDIVALQETWLMPHEITLPDSLSGNFHAFSTSSVNVGNGLLRGRPYGGLTFMWHKRLSKVARIVTYDDERLLGLLCSFNESSVLFLNVYLPTECSSNYDEFMCYLGKIISIVNDTDVDSVCILGDFNASPSSSHYCELQNICSEHDLVVADVACLPTNSYTHVNNNSNSCSWLDHVVLSNNIVSSFDDCTIQYGGATSDHFPICFSLCPATNLVLNDHDTLENTINWDFTNLNKRMMFQQLLTRHLEMLEISIPVCSGLNCNYGDHCKAIDSFYESLRGLILKVAEAVYGFKKKNKHVVPGWNMYVSELHDTARRDFLYWRSIGSPREGPIAVIMRASRARFKLALRECKREEERMRAEALAAKMVGGDGAGFWKDVKSLCPQRPSLAGRVDDAVGDQQIVNLWKERFHCLLNSVDSDIFHNEVHDRCRDSRTLDVVTMGELMDIVKGLPNNKAVGDDGIPAEVYKYAPQRLLVILSLFLTTCLRHQYLPDIIMKVIIIPLLKSKLKDPSSSDNYRPIAIATSFSKIIESLIHKRIDGFLSTADNQFGFRKHHSTDLCIFVLKDVVNYYLSLNTPVFMCFLDIKKAFDRVNHFNLFKKLLDRGVPPYIVKLLCFWYRHQLFQVKWGQCLSQPFAVTNGIRQGGLLSPYLFNIYVDGLSLHLNETSVGCHVADRCINHLSYADDMVLMAPSVRSLQRLLDVCSAFAMDNDIIYNTKKSVCMIMWPKRARLFFSPSLYLYYEKWVLSIIFCIWVTI